jgi:hypothetical protein
MLEKQNRITLIALILSSLLVFTGVISLGFTYILFPVLVPGYGGGKPFLLASYNNYTTAFLWYSNSKLQLTIKANRTVQINIDGKNVHNGTDYELSLEPKDYTLIMLKSNFPVAGRYKARQEPSWIMQFGAIGLFLTGLITTTVILTTAILKRKISIKK